MSLRVRVKPRASKSRVLGSRAGELVVAVRAAPAEGLANEELLRVLAEYLEVARSALVLVRGHGGRSKVVGVALPAVRLDEVIGRLRELASS